MKFYKSKTNRKTNRKLKKKKKNKRKVNTKILNKNLPLDILNIILTFSSISIDFTKFKKKLNLIKKKNSK